MGSQRRRRRRRRPIGPFIVVLLGIAGLLAALYWLGTLGDPEEEAPPNRVATATPTRTATPTPGRRQSRERRRTTPTRVTLRLTATDSVFVCLVDATGQELIDGVILNPGQTTRRFRSQRFRANFGNGNVRMNVGGRNYDAAKLDRPVGYELRPGRRPRRLAESVRTGLCAT